MSTAKGTQRQRDYQGRYASDGERRTAEEAHAQTQARLDQRAQDVGAVAAQAPVRLHRIFQSRLSELDLDGRDPKTITRNRLSFERFQAWLDGEGIVANEVTETDLRVYFVKALPTLVSERTVETEAQHVKTAYVYAFEDRLISENAVTRRVKVPKAVTPEPTPYSMTEMRQLRAAVRDDLDDLIFTAYAYAGLRRNELVDLSRADVDLDEGILCIVGKGNKPRRVPIHPILNRCLAFYMARHPSGDTVLGKGGSSRNVNQRFRNLLRRAGLNEDGSNRPLHRIRKTAATSLRREGVHGDVIDRIFGWTPLDVRQRYYSGVDDGELHEAILLLYRSDPIERPVGASEPQTARRRRTAA